MASKHRMFGRHRYKIYGTANTKTGAKELKSFAREAGYKVRLVGGKRNWKVYYHK